MPSKHVIIEPKGEPLFPKAWFDALTHENQSTDATAVFNKVKFILDSDNKSQLSAFLHFLCTDYTNMSSGPEIEKRFSILFAEEALGYDKQAFISLIISHLTHDSQLAPLLDSTVEFKFSDNSHDSASPITEKPKTLASRLIETGYTTALPAIPNLSLDNIDAAFTSILTIKQQMQDLYDEHNSDSLSEYSSAAIEYATIVDKQNRLDRNLEPLKADAIAAANELLTNLNLLIDNAHSIDPDITLSQLNAFLDKLIITPGGPDSSKSLLSTKSRSEFRHLSEKLVDRLSRQPLAVESKGEDNYRRPKTPSDIAVAVAEEAKSTDTPKTAPEESKPSISVNRLTPAEACEKAILQCLNKQINAAQSKRRSCCLSSLFRRSQPKLGSAESKIMAEQINNYHTENPYNKLNSEGFCNIVSFLLSKFSEDAITADYFQKALKTILSNCRPATISLLQVAEMLQPHFLAAPSLIFSTMPELTQALIHLSQQLGDELASEGSTFFTPDLSSKDAKLSMEKLIYSICKLRTNIDNSVKDPAIRKMFSKCLVELRKQAPGLRDVTTLKYAPEITGVQPTQCKGKAGNGHGQDRDCTAAVICCLMS